MTAGERLAQQLDAVVGRERRVSASVHLRACEWLAVNPVATVNMRWSFAEHWRCEFIAEDVFWRCSVGCWRGWWYLTIDAVTREGVVYCWTDTNGDRDAEVLKRDAGRILANAAPIYWRRMPQVVPL